MSTWCPGHSRQTATIRHVKIFDNILRKLEGKMGRLSVASKMTLPSRSSRNFTIKQPRVFEAVVWRSRTAMPNDVWIRDRRDKEGGARKVATRSMIDCSCRLSYGFVFAFLNLQYLINYRGTTLGRNGKNHAKSCGQMEEARENGKHVIRKVDFIDRVRITIAWPASLDEPEFLQLALWKAGLFRSCNTFLGAFTR